ncbi:hypothetical protein [Hahella ganghwensis]|uniref:hypothetical protein n=1 Tax=Hahella ganghwensis TaxID=286420 RepID=UPI000381A61F|nr:hypothetical protein [Hahella ganghwensis]
MTDSNTPRDPAKEIARLTEELRQLREDVDSSYYRIPKQEFENITVRNITHDVTEHINSKLAKIRNWLGGGLLVFSFLGITQVSKILELETQKLASNLNSELDERMDFELANINQEIVHQTKQSELNQAEFKVFLQQELSRIEEQINSKAVLVERKQVDLEDKMTNLFADVELAQSSIYRAELASIRDDLKKSYQEYKPARRQALDRLTPLLARVTRLQDTTLANEYLDELFRWTFQLGEYEKLDQYRVKYEENFEFNPTTWANIAIADMFLYEESGSPIYLQRALDANNKALQRLPSYGVPQAVRLILHAIEIERAPSEELKTRQLNQAEALLHQLNSGSNLITVYEAYDYLKQLESDHVASKYISKLQEYFNSSVATLEQGYTDYLISRGELPAAGEGSF